MKINRLLLFALCTGVITASLSGCWFFPEEEELLEPPALASDSKEFITRTISKTDLVNQTVYTGYVTASAEYELSFEGVSGKLAEIYVKAGESVKKGDLVAELDTSAIQREYDLQLLYEEKAKIAYNKAVSENKSPADIETARLNLQIEKTKLSDYSTQLSSAKLYAPGNGLVSFVDNASTGDYIESHKIIVKIVDTSGVGVKYEASSTSQFKKDDKVILRYDGKLYDGVISDVPEQIIAEGAVNTVYATFLNETPSVDAIGKIGDIIVVHDKRENVVAIAKQLVKTYDGQNYVYILKDGERTKQEVTLGMESDTQYEVLSGLSEGDVIIIG